MSSNDINKSKLTTDWIQCETTSDTIESHRGRDGYNWKGQKGKELLWTLPVLVKKSADEILNKIYNCEHWRSIGKGRETSIRSPDLIEYIWKIILPYIDIKNMRDAPKGESDHKSMLRTQTKGTYITQSKTKDEIIPSNECYTFYQSVEFVVNYFLELNENYFKDKVVYCNCDDVKSAFWVYFYNNFSELGLKKLIATSFDGTKLSYGNDTGEQMSLFPEQNHWKQFKGYILRYDGNKIERTPPEKVSSTFHGDFKDKICFDIAKKEADIIMTNPPFGELWEQYVNCMMETGKILIFWGNHNAVFYNWFMPYLDKKQLYIVDACSSKSNTQYYMSCNYYKKSVTTFIYTTENMSFQKPDKKYYSTKKEVLESGTAYYDDKGILICDQAIIPIDTDEVLAVSTTIIKYGILNDGWKIADYHRYGPIVNKKEKFARILIQKVK